jgi:hypothetical protein
MQGVETPRRASNGEAFVCSLLVALGWYVMVASAVYVGWSGIPTVPPEDCSAVFSCMSRAEEARLFMLVIAFPLLTGGVLVTVAVAAVLVRLVRSPAVTGTVSALGGAVGMVGAVVVIAARHGAL